MTGNDVLIAIMERDADPVRMHKISDTEYEVEALDSGCEPVRYRVIDDNGTMKIYYK